MSAIVTFQKLMAAVWKTLKGLTLWTTSGK